MLSASTQNSLPDCGSWADNVSPPQGWNTARTVTQQRWPDDQFGGKRWWVVKSVDDRYYAFIQTVYVGGRISYQWLVCTGPLSITCWDGSRAANTDQCPKRPKHMSQKSHIVSAGETPMQIAAWYTGNPHHITELIAANPHKPLQRVAGVTTFASLAHGEQLNIPKHWALPE